MLIYTFQIFRVNTNQGNYKSEKGEIKNAGTDKESLVVTGSYSYIGDDGRTYSVNYIADENGFRPSGDHIPHSAGVVVIPTTGVLFSVPAHLICSLASCG